MRTAAKLKVDFVLKIARKDKRFFNDLAKDPVRTLLESGIDLSNGEIVAVLDVVSGGNLSPLAPILTDHVSQWAAISNEHTL